MTRIPALVVIAVFAGAPIAAAQTPVGTFAALTRDVTTGTALVITDASGKQQSGRLASISDSALELDIDGQVQRFTEAEVKLIERRRFDSLVNGTAIGAGIGAGLAVIAAAAVCDDDCDGGDVAGAIGVYAAIGGLIGVSVDAAVRALRPIYVAGVTSSASLQWTVAPQLSREATGVRLSLRF
jgi:hypothetical protein